MKQKTFGAVVSPIVWNVLSIVFGALFIAYNREVFHWVLLFCGVYLVILGLLPTIKALFNHQTIPFTAIWSLVCGVLLIIFNPVLASVLFVLLGLLLLIVGLQQLNNFLTMRRFGLRLRWYFYLFPTLAVAAGIFTVCNPLDMEETLFTFVGWFLVIHGLISVIGVISTLFITQPEAVIVTDSSEAESAEEAEAEEVKETSESSEE
jgi:uncharacterized membrane protein HdeD (DUF308 family)